MKTKRQTKVEPASDKPKAAKRTRSSASKPSPDTNGKNPLVSYEHAPIGIVECSPEGRYINVNEEFCHLLGYVKEDLIGKSLKEITHEDDYPVDIRLHQQLVEGKIPFYRLEERFIHKDGGIIWVELTRSVVRDAAGTPLKTIGVVLDISDRKHVERVLRDSSERLRLATESARMFMWELDLQNRIYTFADNLGQVLGFSAGLLPKNNVETVERLSPAEDVRAFWDALVRAIQSHSDLNSLQFRIINPENGQTVWLEANAKIVYDDDGTAERIFGVAQNITERKRIARQQEALYQLTDQLHRTNSLEDIFNAALDAILSALQCDRASILLFDETDLMHFVAWRGLSDGYRKATDGHSPWKSDEKNPELICMNDVNTGDLSDSLRAVIKDEGIGALAFIPLVANGKLIGKFMTYYNAPHIFSEGEVELSLTIARQLAFGVDRKRAEVQLRESEERYRTIVDTSNEGIWYVDLNAETVYLNEPMAHILGYSVDEVIGRKLPEFCFAEDMSNAQEHIASNYQGNYEHFDFRFRRKDGEEVLVLASTSPVRDGTGKLIGTLGMFVDITERKNAEHQLRQIASFDEAVMGNLGEGLYTVDSDGYVTSMNPAAEKMFGRTIEEIRGRRMHDVTHYKHPDGTPFPAEDCAGFQVLHHGQKLVHHEDVFIRKDGTFFDVIYSSSALWDNGKIDGLVVVFNDNTTRKQAEKRLVLLSEISELVRRSEEPNELMFAVSAAVGDHFQAKRCLFNEIDVENDIEIVHRDYCQGVESVAGIHRISDYSSITSGEMEAGITVVNHDSKVDPRTAPDYERSYLSNGERAYVTVPLMRANRWVASLWLSDDMPRQWSQEDVSLLETIAERTWIAVEKLRINSALRASEALYRTIARSIPGGGIYVVDKDMRYLVADGAVTEAFGLSREMLEGHTVSEVFRDQQRSRMIEHLQRNFAGETISYETEHNGRVYWTQQAPLLESIGQVIIVTLDITERKQMEEALRQSEERFSQFMQHLPGLAWIKDKQGRYVYANASAEAAFKTPLEKLYGKADEDVFSSDVATQFKKNDDLALRDKNGVQVVETLEHDDGILHYSLVNKFPIPGPDGDIELIGGTAFDITEQRQAEEALRRNEKMFSTLVDAAPFGVYFIDSEFRLRAINKGSEAVFSGIQPLIGRDFAEIIHLIWQEPFATEVIERFRHTLLTGESFISPTVIEERANIEEIQSYDWQIHRITLSDGTLGVVCYFYDLSDQKRMEAAVRASEERYRDLFDLVPVAVYSCDANGLIQEYNHSALELWGREPAKNDPHEKFCGSFKIYYSDGRFMPHEKCPMARMLKGETLEPQELEIVVERPDGVRRSVIAHPLPIRNVRGEIVEAINCLYDITERKQAEDALQALNLQLETRVVMRTAELQEANTALHESRRRLQILSQRLVEVQEEERRAIARELHDRVGQSLSALNINMIIMRDQLLPDSLERVASRLSDSMHLVGETITLVRDVMSNLRPAVLDDYGLEAALQSYVDEYRPRYGIKVELERPAQPLPRLGPSIEMTFLRIAQEALMNIARHANASQVTLSLWQEGDSICMTVQDNGTGIVSWPEANRPGSHGLTIMRERAEAFGGNLKVGSVPGKGTRVEMSIPIGKDSQNEVQKEMLE
jgi:PAS domain S-box-containing protein